MTDFFDKGASKDTKNTTTTRKVSDSKAKAKKVVDSDDEADMSVDIPRPPPRRTVARAAAKKYVEVASEGDEGDDSLFMDD